MLHPFRFEFVTPRWRSEVPRGRAHRFGDRAGLTLIDDVDRLDLFAVAVADAHHVQQIGRASCWERVCQYLSVSVVYGTLKKNTISWTHYIDGLRSITHTKNNKHN